MTTLWFYQVNGFDLGPVPQSELHRLSQKGRIAPRTPVRPEGGDWMEAEQALGLGGKEAVGSRSGLITVLHRMAPFGIPMGMALLPWGRAAACVGLLILSPFAAASFRLLLGIATGRKPTDSLPHRASEDLVQAIGVRDRFLD
jgi:hypothetical protein